MLLAVLGFKPSSFANLSCMAPVTAIFIRFHIAHGAFWVNDSFI